jgi:hypothetical protein
MMKNIHHTQLAWFVLNIGISVGLVLLLLVVSWQEASSQSWQPAARLWGMQMQPYVLHTPGHPPLIPMSKAGELPGTDTFAFYAIPTLKPGVEAYGDLHGLSTVGRPPIDFTANGRPELIGPTPEGVGTMLLDAYTPSERRRSVSMPGIDTPGDFGDPVAAVVDCDGDGVTDVFRSETAKLLKIVYGDEHEPFSQSSTALYYLPSEAVPIVEALGTLEGIPHALKYTTVKNLQTGKDELQYILEELNPDDVLSRRDTIRTRVVDREVVHGELYWSVIITFDSLWHLPAYWSSDKPNTSLRVTRQGLEVVEVDTSFRSYDGYSLVGESNYGQRKLAGQQSVRIDGRQPFLYHNDDVLDSTTRLRWIEMYRILDATRLKTELKGRMRLENISQSIGRMWSACLVSDVDGDSIPDAMIHYTSQNQQTQLGEDLVDLFITTHRFGTYVSPTLSSDHSLAPEREHMVRRLSPSTWQVTLLRTTSSIPLVVRLVDVRGREIGRARVSIQSATPDSTVISLDVENVVYPVWAQIGNLSIRLQ